MAGTNEFPHEPRFRFDSVQADNLLEAWGEVGRECVRSLRMFARKNPMETVAIAVLAGTILGAWLGRRR